MADLPSPVSVSVSFLTRCPCLRCAVKIVQSGVKEVVYSQVRICHGQNRKYYCPSR